MGRGDNPRLVVTSLADPTPEAGYRDLSCARGRDENLLKAVNNDPAGERGSDHAFLANPLRRLPACAAYRLSHSLREHPWCLTSLAKAQPRSLLLKLFKLALRVVQDQDRIRLHLPSACPVKGGLPRLSELLDRVRPPTMA